MGDRGMVKWCSVRWSVIWRQLGRPALFAAALVGLLRSAGVDWNYVFSNSMSPSIHVGDCILVNKLAYDVRFPLIGWRHSSWAEPERGDVVLLHAPDDGEPLVKRVVGLPGDRIEFRGNHLLINGEVMPVDSELASETQRAASNDGDYQFTSERLGTKVHKVVFCSDRPSYRSLAPVLVRADQYFVLGDNRDESVDSRSFGLVRRDQIIGRVIGVTLAFNPTKHFAPAWDRCFRRVL
jgi:signal peptidase I